ncbi:hypothetical protein [Azospirillum agricola]|uniref:hypothetical protein n=1 Tax=Azospirillum agricola TaxID=1720247 RepID=UPI000A0EFDAF|nr:hypothetical protein [Azospirillum agricola]SMH62524.1 hypothetical protein SAMN02982994_6327 [Azospirillum lipoferum]
MDNFARRPSGLLVPPELRLHRPQHCDLLGGNMMMGGNMRSPWASYTGAQDGAATALPWPLATSMNGSARGAYGVVLLTATKGVVIWPEAPTNGLNCYTVMSFCVFTVSGSTISWGSRQAFTTQFAPSGYAVVGSNGARMVTRRINDSQAVVWYSSERNGGSTTCCNAFVFTLDGSNNVSLGAINKDYGVYNLGGSSVDFGPGPLADRLQPLGSNAWVDGGWVHSVSGTTFSATNPVPASSINGMRGVAVLDATHVVAGIVDLSNNFTYKVYAVSGAGGGTWTEIRSFAPPYSNNRNIVFGMGNSMECECWQYETNGYFSAWGKIKFSAGTYVPTFTQYATNPATNTWWYQNPDNILPDGKANLLWWASGSTIQIAAQTISTIPNSTVTPAVTATTSSVSNTALIVEVFPPAMPGKAVLGWNNATTLYLKILVAA